MTNDIITMVPEGSEQRQLQSCTGKKCFWCSLTGHHSQTPEERNLLVKQAVVGILVLTILAFIVIVSIGLAFKVVTT
jgi:hypothetical protein